jgi:DNA-binding response OmpR family regulator
MRILLIEDEPEMAGLLSARVGRAGYVVDTVGCIAEAEAAIAVAAGRPMPLRTPWPPRPAPAPDRR